MKTIFKFLSISVLVISLLTACQKDELRPSTTSNAVVLTSPKPSNNSSTTHELTPENFKGNNNMELSVAATVTATISGVSSSESTFGTYGSYLGVDIDGNTSLTINGNNFGASRGTVTLSGNFQIASISSWTNTKIVVKAKSFTNSGASNSITITVKPISDAQTIRNAGSRTISLVNTVYSRQLGQCTWWASVRRYDTGRSVQPRGQSYSAVSGNIDNNYVPQAGDIWLFGTSHQCYVESSNSSTVDNKDSKGNIISRTTTFTINLSEYNIKPEAYSSYTTTVKITTNVATGTKTRTSGTFRSGYSSEATKFYR